MVSFTIVCHSVEIYYLDRKLLVIMLPGVAKGSD